MKDFNAEELAQEKRSDDFFKEQKSLLKKADLIEHYGALQSLQRKFDLMVIDFIKKYGRSNPRIADLELQALNRQKSQS